MTPYAPLQQMSPFVTHEIYRDRIAIFTILHLGREAMDEWFQMTDAWYTEAEQRPHPAERVVLTLQDFSQVAAGVTPYGRAKAQELVSNHPAVKGRSALIVSHMLYVTLTTEKLIHALEGQVERRVFHDKAVGLQWLEQALPARSV